METMTREWVIATLRRANPNARLQDLSLYASHFCDFAQADANVLRNGGITLHPRSGAPIKNPYLDQKEKATKALTGFRLHTEELWRVYAQQIASISKEKDQ